MTRVLKQYATTILLLAGIILGGLSGLVFGEKTMVVKPLGDLFLNLMFMILIPLVFFSITSAIANMTEMKRLGKIIGATFLVFLGTGFISAIIGYLGVLVMDPLKNIDTTSLEKLMSTATQGETTSGSVLQKLVETFTVSDFQELLSKNNMLALIVFSLLIGVGTSLAGENGQPFAKFLGSANDVMMKVVSVIMIYAPIGLGCFFATTIGSLGAQMITGYARIMLLYLLITVVYFFGVMSLYALTAGGRLGLKNFWRNIPQPAITAIATSSSAACIPINLTSTKAMGVPADIAETVIPLGANTHKDGSVIGGILKIAFLFSLFEKNFSSPQNMVSIILGAFLVGMVMGAIPGGGMVAETVIITLFGFPMEALPLILIISTIIDIPATLLNSSGNTVSAMLVARIVEGKSWLSSRHN
ncbi:dicarboxylate/amino acid:cation symporter [Vagococcus sp. BWB3-3]|uniref:Dicarboxylate/amino acid:cation symporter n=1 Tax=Vagococcus allomyrinae TaxID=2794353 RepID=A0A940SR56_9ENTE|nr:dicarboxylate/amino acid:cation symporter [Vagococcus allomyrinae]MBP1040437.1 dicarboxylate/amino acid:cation symporter [Vagococcus allomyrinae]